MARDLELPITTPADVRGIDRTAKALDRLADQLDDTGDEARQAERDIAALNDELGETERQIRELARRRAAGDDTVIGDLKKLRQARNELKALKKDLAVPALPVAPSVPSLPIPKGVGGIGALKASPGALGIAAAPEAAGLVALLGASTGAAILGGVGIGGIIGGIAAAARDGQVKQAGEQLGHTISDAFSRKGLAFVDPTRKALDILADAGENFIDRIDIGKLADEIPGLARGLGGLGTNTLPGLNKALDAAQPIIRIISKELPELGDAFSDALGSISDDSDGAVLALNTLFDAVETGVRFAGDSIEFLEKTYEKMVHAAAKSSGVMEDILGWMPGVGDGFRGINDHAEDLLANLDRANLDQTADDFRAVAGAESLAAGKLAELNSEFDKYLGKTLGVSDATIAHKDAMNDLTKSLKESKGSLDLNSEAGRTAQAAFNDAARAVADMRQANIDAGMSVDDANRKYGEQIDALGKAAVKSGANKRAVDDMIASLKAVPLATIASVGISGLKSFLDAAAAMKLSLDKIPKSVLVGVGIYDMGGKYTSPYSYTGKSAGGPIEGRGPRGVDSVPIMAAPGEYMLTEAMVGKLGGVRALEGLRLDRTNPYAAAAPAVGAAGAGRAGGTSAPVHLHVHLDSREVHSALIDYAVTTGRNPADLWPASR